MNKQNMSKEQFEKKILEKINETGFPLELRVARFLQENGYYIANNLYYVDQDEEKGREVDLRALKNVEAREGEKPLRVRHCFLVECKRSADKPWVIFTSPETPYDRGIYELDCKGFASNAKWNVEEVLNELKKIHPFASYKRRGRSYFEPFKGTNEGEMIFKSLTTSVKATISTRNSKFAAGNGSICFYYPLVVFEGNLYEAYLENDNISLAEVDSVMVSFFYQSVNYKEDRLVVPVVTEQGLASFCSKMDATLQFFGELLKKNITWFELR